MTEHDDDPAPLITFRDLDEAHAWDRYVSQGRDITVDGERVPVTEIADRLLMHRRKRFASAPGLAKTWLPRPISGDGGDPDDV